MSIADGLIGELKIVDVLTFLTVQRCGTISSAARELMVTPSQVSKTISRIEVMVGSPLLARSASGVALLEEGRRLVPQFEQMLALARALSDQRSDERRVLGLAAPSYLARYFAPLIAEHVEGRIRILEKPPAQIRALMASGHFDVALGLGELPHTPAWESQIVGKIEKAWFARPEMAARLGPGPISQRALAGVPIVSPLYVTELSSLPVDDGNPIPRHLRTLGHEASTFGVALALAARTDQIVYGPLIGALPLLDAGRIVKLDVEDGTRHDLVRLTYNTDRITKPVQRTLISAIESGLTAIRY